MPLLHMIVAFDQTPRLLNALGLVREPFQTAGSRCHIATCDLDPVPR